MRRFQSYVFFKPAITVFCAFVFMSIPLSSSGEDTELQKLESLVDQLIQLQKEKRTVVKQWEEDQHVLNAEKKLLKRQKQELDKNEAERRKRIKKLKQKKQERQDRSKKLVEKVNRLISVTSRLRKHLLDLRPRLPLPLAEKTASNFRTLKEQHETISEQNLVSSMNVCMTIVREALRFNRRFHTERRIMTTPDGERREMKVLYAGLANAFGVSTGESQPVACRGLPGKDGWTWSWNEQWVKPIRRAFRVYDRKEPASFVDLPLAHRDE